jgi:diguanylate cyclase (GGDEF)-like protein/PAS domain S-box-containing protein
MPRPSYATLKTRLFSSFSLLIALLAALMFWKISSGMQSDREAAFSQTRSFAKAISAHVESEVRVIDLSLLRAAEALGALDGQALRDPVRAGQILVLSTSASDTSFWIHFIDARGMGVAASNGLSTTGVSYLDHSYFTAHSSHGVSGLHVSAPETGRLSRRRVFFMSRSVFRADGEFLGVVVASVDAAALAQVFANALFQPTLSITLLHANGQVAARAPLFERSFAADLSPSDFYRHWKAAPSGSYEGRSMVDGQWRVFSYQTVGQFDLAVAVGIAAESWTRAIPWNVAVALGALAVIALSLAFSGRFALHSFARIERSQADQQRLNEQLRAARDENARGEKRARMIADSLPALVAYIDVDKRYVFHNSHYQTILGTSASAMVGRTISDVLGAAAYESIAPQARLALSGERVSFEQSLAIGLSERWFKFEYTPDFDESGATMGFYTMGIDITDMKEAQQRLSASARIDELTGLPNRTQLYERLTEALARSEQGGAKTACLFLDIDHFKSINDSLGHAGGDDALREFGDRLKSTVRETDVVARLAGDEFVIVLEGADQPESAQVVASKIIEAMRPPFLIAGTWRAVSTSIGVAMSDGHGDDADEVLKRADEALYRVKRAGRGGFATSSNE